MDLAANEKAVHADFFNGERLRARRGGAGRGSSGRGQRPGLCAAAAGGRSWSGLVEEWASPRSSAGRLCCCAALAALINEFGCLLRGDCGLLSEGNVRSLLHCNETLLRKGFLAVNRKYECKPAKCIKACLNTVTAARILHEFLHLDACLKLILVQLCTLWVTVYPFWM